MGPRDAISAILHVSYSRTLEPVCSHCIFPSDLAETRRPRCRTRRRDVLVIGNILEHLGRVGDPEKQSKKSGRGLNICTRDERAAGADRLDEIIIMKALLRV